MGDLVCTELRNRTLEALDCQSVIVKDRPGFVVNKALFAYLAEAVRIYDEENIRINEFEKLFTIGAGMPCGPLKLVELIGVDTTMQILHSIYDSTGEMHYKPSKLLEHMIKSDRLGKKNGHGFVEPEVGTFLI